MKFDQYAQDGRRFVREVAVELGDARNMQQAERVMTAVLHTIRDILSPEESLHFISQLPMLVKAMYVNGWHFHPRSRIRSAADFVECLMLQCPRTAPRDFGDDEIALRKTHAVIRVLKRHISAGEIRDVMNQFPEALVSLWGNGPLQTSTVDQQVASGRKTERV